MGRRPFRGRHGISGPQPTFAALAKAKASSWGTKRAKAGQRVSRMDAFPDEGGKKLVESSDDEMTTKGRRASSSLAAKVRAHAATKRSFPARTGLRSPPAFDLPSGVDSVSSVSSHSSDEEPDSDDPDRESSKTRRWNEKVAAAKAKSEARKRGKGRQSQDDQEQDEREKLRKARLAAAEKRAKESRTIVIDGTDTEEEREWQAMTDAKGAVSSRAGKCKAQGALGEKAKSTSRSSTKGKGRTLGFSSDKEEEKDGDATMEVKASNRAILFNPSSSASSDSDEDLRKSKAVSKVKAPRKPRKSLAFSSDSGADDGDDAAPAPSPPGPSSYAHLNLPSFTDPRAALAKRKARELSDPPTDAFSSSGGSDADEGPNGRIKGKGAKKAGGGGDLGDEFAKMERRMKLKKRKYREERRPGYSNPRRN
ncbi:hypothetical protein JCM5296_003896 [Sporobolomyces johnsonii]